MSQLGTTNPFGKDTWLPGATKQYEAALGYVFPVMDANPDWRVDGRNIFGKTIVGASLGSKVIPADTGAGAGSFPAGDDATFDEFKLAMSRLSHTIELSYDEFELLNSNDSAAVPVVAAKTTLAVEQITRDALRMMWMDGTARLARCAVSTATTTVNLQSVNGDAGGANQVDRDRWLWLDSGRAKIDIVSAATGTPIANGVGRKIISTTRDAGGNTITLDAAGGNVTTAATDVIVWSLNVAGGGTYTSREFPGILAAMDSANTYLNINRATPGKEIWRGNVVTGATAGTNENISLANLHKLIHKIATTYGKQPVSSSHYCCYNLGVQGAILTYLAGGIRMGIDNVDVAPKGFQETIPVLGMAGRPDIHAPRNNFFMFCNDDDSTFRWVKPKNRRWSIMDFAAGAIQGIWNLKPTAGAASYDAAFLAYLNGLMSLMTPRPNAHGRLTDITEQGVAY